MAHTCDDQPCAHVMLSAHVVIEASRDSRNARGYIAGIGNWSLACPSQAMAQSGSVSAAWPRVVMLVSDAAWCTAASAFQLAQAWLQALAKCEHTIHPPTGCNGTYVPAHPKMMTSLKFLAYRTPNTSNGLQILPTWGPVHERRGPPSCLFALSSYGRVCGICIVLVFWRMFLVAAI